MSKTTKIIAALGVVAGLGVAALPAFSFATGPAITGDVEVQVEVPAAIAMTITGNNDHSDSSTTADDHDAATFVVVADPTGHNPAEDGYYTLSGHVYTAATESEPVVGTTYYQKITPSYAPVSNYNGLGIGDSVDGYTATALPVLGTSSSYALLYPGDIINGNLDPESQDYNGFGSTITVYTNYNSGYILSVQDKDANNDLTHEDGTFYIPSNSSIAAGTAAGWNIDVTRVGLEPITAAEVPVNDGTATALTIDTTNTKTQGGRVAKVEYNVATASDQASGKYADVIVYTATAN